MNEQKDNRQDLEMPSAIPAPTTLVRDDSVLPSSYPGSGLNKSPARMMKIEEVVEWDMEFGVKFGPVGYDHRLVCPYCRKRMLLVSHEGSRHQKAIRIVYQCENCGAHTVVQFQKPNEDLNLPELHLGEKIMIENPSPLPQGDREKEEANKSAKGNRNNQKQEKPAKAKEVETLKAKKDTKQGSLASSQRTQNNSRNRSQNIQDTESIKAAQIPKHPVVRLPGETIKKMQPNTPKNKNQPTKAAPEKRSNAYFRSRRKGSTPPK